MTLTIENIKKNYLLLLVKLLIVALFSFVAISGYNDMQRLWIFNSNLERGILNYLKFVFTTTYYRPTLIFAIPLIGVFINKKIGWILITSFFYYFLFGVIFYASTELFIENHDIIYLAAFTLIMFILLGIMNIKKVRKLNYGISKSELISKNIVASVIGISLTVIIVLMENK